ncbi:hypothetical protein ACTXT7_014649 [Hymenolepis weldensis]
MGAANGYSDTSEESSDEDELLLRAELREQEQRALNDLDIAMENGRQASNRLALLKYHQLATINEIKAKRWRTMRKKLEFICLP